MTSPPPPPCPPDPNIFFYGKNGMYSPLAFQCAIACVCTSRRSCYVQKRSFLANAHFPCRPAISFVGMKTLKFEPHLIRPQTPEKNRPRQWRLLPPKTFWVPKNLIESSLAGNGLSMKLSFAMSWQFFHLNLSHTWHHPETPQAQSWRHPPPIEYLELDGNELSWGQAFQITIVCYAIGIFHWNPSQI